MTNLTAKKIVAAAASLVVASGVVAGALTYNSNSNATPETTGVVNVDSYTAEGDASDVIEVGGYELPIVVKGSDKANELIYGTANKDINPDDYFFGTASFFTLFGRDITITAEADTEGRIAAETLVNNTNNKAYYAKNQMNSTDKLQGAAAVICENDATITLEWSATSGSIVISDEVVNIGGEHKTQNGAGIYVADKDNFIIDFDAEMAMLKEKSAMLAQLPANLGPVNTFQGKTTIECYDEQLNVFTFTPEQWEKIAKTEVNIITPVGTSPYVVINVPGVNPTVLQPELTYNGEQIGNTSSTNQKVVFNFYEAETVSTNSVYRGAIFAPNATISGGNGHNRGQLIGETITVDAEQGYWSFSMPTKFYTDYQEEYGETIEEYYNAHFYYWDYENGEYVEYINYNNFFVPGSFSELYNAHRMGDKITNIPSGKDIAEVSGLEAYANLENVTWEYFYDINNDGGSGENITEEYPSDEFITQIPELMRGNNVHLDDSYLVKWDSLNTGDKEVSYTFSEIGSTGTSSNVYFVVRTDDMRTNVEATIEVHYADNNNESNKRNTVDFAIPGTTDLNDIPYGYVPINFTIDEYQDDVNGIYQNVQVTFTPVQVGTFLPLLDENGKVINYLAQYDGNDFTYTIPDGYSEYKPADTDLTDGKGVIYLTLNSTDYNVVLDLSNCKYPDYFVGVNATLYADGLAIDNATFSVNNEQKTFNNLPIYSNDMLVDYRLETSLMSDKSAYKIDRVDFDSTTNTYTIVVSDSYIDAYARVIYNDNYQGDKRSPASVIMDAVNASGAYAPETVIPLDIIDGNGTRAVQIADDIAGLAYTIDDLTTTVVPEGYEVERIEARTIGNNGEQFGSVALNRGDIAYTVYLKVKTYNVRFYDANGNYLHNQSQNSLNKPSGTQIQLQYYNGITNNNGMYKTVWYDKVENKYYNMNSTYTMPAKDVDLYAMVVRDTTNTPRVHFNIIKFNGKHYIPGYKVAQRLEYDQTTDDFTFIGTDFATISEDQTNNYFMLSMVLGVDNTTVASTKFTISTESLTSTHYIYEETVEHSENTSNLIEKFYSFGIHSAGLSGEALLGNDAFLSEYDGYRQVRLVLPAEAYESQKLYVNAYYYDDNGQEYLHGNYVLDIANNNFWKLVK